MNAASITGNARTGQKLVTALAQGGMVITANQRLARWYQQCYSAAMLEQGLVAWESPNILSLDTWLRELYDSLFVAGTVSRFPLNADMELLLWEQVIDGALANDEDAGLITGAATARTVAGAWRIANEYGWQRNTLPATLDHERYRSWAQQFEQQCERLGVRSAVTVTAVIVEHLTDASITLPDSVTLAGFVAINPSQRGLLDALVTQGVVVDESPDFSHDLQPVCEKMGFRDERDELYCVAGEVRRALEQSADATGNDVAAQTGSQQDSSDPLDDVAPNVTPNVTSSVTIGVVIPDLSSRRTDVLRAFDAVFFPGASPADITAIGRPYDLSLGEPLRQVPPVDAALRLLQFAFLGLDDSGDISQLLSSRYLADAETERESRSAFDIKRRAKAIRSLSIATLLNMERVPGGLARITRQLQNRTPVKPALPSEWFRRIVNVLDAAGWPGEATPDSIDYQAISMFRDLLEGMGQLDVMLGEYSASSALRLVSDMAQSRVFQQEVGSTPIQLLGSLESQGLNFDRLWVMGMDIDSWPGNSRANPFLPLSWQREQNVPGASVQIDVAHARVLTQWWQRSAGHVVFTWPSVKKTIEVDASPLIDHIAVGDIPSVAGYNLTTVAERIHDEISLETCDDHRGPGVVAGDAVNGGARLFEDQASCPFRSFLTHRLRARAVEEPVMGIDARERGNAFHLAMQFFWEQIKTHDALVALDVDTLKTRVNECVDLAMKAVEHESAALQAMEADRNRALMLEWITRHEWLRAPFEVVATEREQTVSLDEISVRLKVDRVDQLESGGQLIVDYKTGKHNSTKSWNEPRITSAQLPLYAALNKEVTGVCFAQVARNRQGFIGLADDGELLPGVRVPPEEQTWEDQVQRWTDRLSVLATEIKHGVASVTPVPGACTYCDLKPVCRIDATDKTSDESDSADDANGAFQ